MATETGGTGGNLHTSHDSTVVVAHELVCRADDRYRDGDFIAAAKLYRQAGDVFDAAAQAASGSLDEHALESLHLLARSHRRKGARLEKMTGQVSCGRAAQIFCPVCDVMPSAHRGYGVTRSRNLKRLPQLLFGRARMALRGG
eukprot:815674-Rhodomonas_salina.2